MAAAAFGLVERSTPYDLHFVLRIGRGSAVRSKDDEDDPHDSDHDGCGDGEYSAEGFTPPGDSTFTSNSIRRPLSLAHSLSGHKVASLILAVDLHRPF